MRTAQARSLLALLTVPALLQVMGACGGAITEPDPFPPGMLSIELQPAASVMFKSVDYDLSRRDDFSRKGPVAVSLDEQKTNFSFTVDDLEPSDYYLLTVHADASVVGESRATTCRGRTSFAIQTGQTTSVSLRVQCAGVTNTGAMVGSQVNQCPEVMALRAAPSRASVGESVALQAEVTDDMIGPRPLSYSWSSNGGTFSGSKADTTFQCKEAGVISINLLVSDGDTSCKDNTSSVMVTCTDAACLAANNCDAVKAPPRSGTAGASSNGGAGRGAGGAGSGGRSVGGAGGAAAGSGGARATQVQPAAAGGGAGHPGSTMMSTVQPQKTGTPTGAAGMHHAMGGAGAAAVGGAGGAMAGHASPAAVGGNSGSTNPTSVSITVPAGGSSASVTSTTAGAAAASGGAGGAAEPGSAGQPAPPPPETGESGENQRPRSGEGRHRRAGPWEGGSGSEQPGSGGTGGDDTVILIVPAEAAGSGGAP